MKVAKIPNRIDVGANRSFPNANASNAVAPAKYTAKAANEGNVKRFLYLFASSSDEESDSPDPPGQRNS